MLTERDKRILKAAEELNKRKNDSSFKNRFLNIDPLVIILNGLLLIGMIWAELYPSIEESSAEIFRRRMNGDDTPPQTLGEVVNWWHWLLAFVFLNYTLIRFDRGEVDIKKGIKLGAGKCPYCFKPVSKIASKCPHCTSKI
jgi:hypothetical protein